MTRVILVWLAVVAASLGLMAVAKAANEQDVWTLDAYVRQIEDALAALTADEHSGLAEAQRLLAGVTAVRLRSGEILPLTSLLADVHQVDVARARLLAVREQIILSREDNSAARLAMLQAVLARPEFNRLETVWDRFWRWLRSWLDSLWPDSISAPQSTLGESLLAVLGWTILIAIAVVLAALLSYWLQSFLSGIVRDSEVRRRRQLGDNAPLTAAEARQRASALAQAGDFRQAVRHLYLSALLILEEQRLLPVDRSLTNREMLAGVANSRELSTHFAPVVTIFDEVWYGVHEPDAETYRRYAAEIDELTALARQAEQARR